MPHDLPDVGTDPLRKDLVIPKSIDLEVLFCIANEYGFKTLHEKMLCYLTKYSVGGTLVRRFIGLSGEKYPELRRAYKVNLRKHWGQLANDGVLQRVIGEVEENDRERVLKLLAETMGEMDFD